MEPRFIHLNVHSEYTVTAGTIDLDSLFKRCQKLGYPAIAITDPNLFASLKFYQKALTMGIKPILGSELKVNFAGTIGCVMALVKNKTGYLNLLKLNSLLYLNEAKIIQENDLSQYREGLILLSGDLDAKLIANRSAYFERYFSHHFYLEIARIGLLDEESNVQKMVNCARNLNLPLVATNRVYFLEEQDYEAHEIKVCINGGYTLNDENRPHYQPSQFLKPSFEMEQLFADLPESLINTVEIAKRCNLEIELNKTFLPNFPLPVGEKIDDYLTRVALHGLEERLSKVEVDLHEQYRARFDYELKIIIQMGFSGYFIIVADFINWSKDHHIPVGPGRGSGAGSLVAYALKITDLDPIKYHLLFERFLNPERVSMPDFDIDFCMDGRDRVIEYVMQRYGADKVAQIITYGTMAAKAVVRDVGRVLGYPYGFVDQIAKLIPFTLGITLDQALNEEKLLKERYESEEETRILIDNARKLEGLVRNLGKHAGGVVIAPSALTNFTALYEQGEGVITQLDKDDIATVGLVKFDFLGLRTLTVLNWAIDAINQHLKNENRPLVKLAEIPLDDAETYQLMESGQTTAIFQLESRIAKEVIKKFKPNCFSDMIALVAIIRPGVLQSGMIDEILDRKVGKAKITYLHPKLEPILKETYGVAIYQEQVMQIAQTLAGYTLGEADLLRRAMGKKKIHEMEKHRSIFTKRASEHGIDGVLADDIFNYMEKFASYGFNKSHSAAYGLIAYQTAFLKKHFPAEFMAAILSSEMANTDKLIATLAELKNLGINLLPPNVQTSEFRFKALDRQNILYGLGAIKGVGEGAIEILVRNRPVGGFTSLSNFLKQMDWQKGNKRFLESLIAAGGLDDFNVNRGILFNNAAYLIEHTVNNVGQLSLLAEEEELILPSEAPTWDSNEYLIHEKEVLGTYLSGHPINRFLTELGEFTTLNWRMIRTRTNVKIAGFLNSLKISNTKTGKKIGILNLETVDGYLDAVLFAENFAKNRHKIVKNQLLILEGELSFEEEVYRLRVEKVYDLWTAREKWAKFFDLTLQDLAKDEQELVKILKNLPAGEFKIRCHFNVANEQVTILLKNRYRLEDHQLTLLAKLGCDCKFVY